MPLSDLAVSWPWGHLQARRLPAPPPTPQRTAVATHAAHKTITDDTRQQPSPHGGGTLLPVMKCLKEELPLEAGDQVSAMWARHQDGTCRPCLYFRRPAGCPIGAFCGFCHFEHAPPRRGRMCKKKRGRLRKSIQEQLAHVKVEAEDQESADNEDMGHGHVETTQENGEMVA